jgi:hypothetical protein
MIECEFIKQGQWTLMSSDKEKRKKCGRYHGSYLHAIPGFGKTAWAVMARLKVPNLEELLQEKTAMSILSECVEYLNQPPKRKRRTKKKPKLPYGTLGAHKASVKVTEEGEKYIFAFLSIDEHKNKNFWGEGPRYASIRRRKRKVKATD